MINPKGLKIVKRAEFMAAYEKRLVELAPELCGKVDWDTAQFYYDNCNGKTGMQCAEMYARACGYAAAFNLEN